MSSDKKYSLKVFLALLALSSIGAVWYIRSTSSVKTVQHITAIPIDFSTIDPFAIPQEVKGTLITLRILTPEMFKDYFAMFSEDVRKSLGFPPDINFDYIKLYLSIELKRVAHGELIVYAIFDNASNKLIGSTEIRAMWKSDPGQLGIWINDRYRSKGRTQEAIKLISKVYFNLTNAPTYNAHVEIFNIRSFIALKKAGLRHIGFYFEDGHPSRYILEMRAP